MMAQRIKLLERQKVIGEDLLIILEKLDTGATRQVQVEEIQKRVESKWVEFQDNHAKLVNGGYKNEHYFEVNYFEEVKKYVQDIQQRLKPSQQLEQSISEAAIELKENVCGISRAEGGFLEETPQLVCQEKTVLFKNNCGKSTEKISWFNRDMVNLMDRLMEAISEIQGQTKSVLEVVKMELNEDYKQLNSKLEKLEDEDINKFSERFSEVRSLYYKVLRKIGEKEDTDQISTIPQPTTKLQEIKIPYFHGDPNEWSSFYDLFDTLVNQNKQLSSVEKMFRLKTSVRGDAAKHIQQLSITEYNYKVALETLRERYENKRLLFSTLVDKLLDQPNMNSEKAFSIRQLLDTTNECVRSIEALGIEIEDAKPFIARIVMRKFDSEAMRQYEFNTKKTRQIQKLEDVLNFLAQMSQAQESLKEKKISVNSQQRGMQNHQQKGFARQSSNLTVEVMCVFCKNKGHKIYDCRKFAQLSVHERRHWVTTSKSCKICLHHTTDQKCFKPTFKCKKCGKDHNSLLHYEHTTQPSNNNEKAGVYMTKKDEPTTVLLATALVRIKSLHGEYITLRALVDQGSQRTTISEEATQILQLPRIKAKTELYGLGDTLVGVSNSKVQLEIRPRLHNNAVFNLEALVLKSLSKPQPDASLEYDVANWDNYFLADPNFYKSDRIDVLIGADMYHEILEDGIRKVDTITGQATKLGWMLSGLLRRPTRVAKTCSTVATTLEKFWEIEEIPEKKDESPHDSCVKYFERTTTTDSNGRFIVRLPFEENIELGESRKQAMARFLSLERKLDNDSDLKHQYVKFMQDYQEKGHMVEAANNSGKYYLPHQAVIREDSLTTKLRVVFDASAKSTNKRSLNDILKIGPKLQNDIFDVIIKWRLWGNVMTADVEKMYRQILIHEDDQPYQHILWREDKNQPIREFKLTTVTYGTSSAPFLAKKVLAQIGVDCLDDELNNIISNDFYMDDLMTGADSVEECKQIQKKLSLQLGKFGLPIRKWISNNNAILEAIPNKGNMEVVPINSDEAVKTLGLQWHPNKDVFMFNIEANHNGRVTKRRALSTLARIFDPIGWLAPFTASVKLFIQKLWMMKANWDDEINDELQKEWDLIMRSLPSLREQVIPRWYKTTRSSKVELHGFADASQKAYAAVVYIKVDDIISLVAGRSKVNPVKNRKTLPKLELCAAHLLAKLTGRILSIMQRQVEVNTWSDSTITLAWIVNNKSKDRFIKSRVDEIKTLLPRATWRHVDTKSNPADEASRGVSADKISRTWWTGPSWLKYDRSQWPSQNSQKITLTTRAQRTECWLNTLSTRCSSFRKLERVIAYVKRFIGKLKRKKYPNWLTSEELKMANYVIVCQHQEHFFFSEIMNLRQQKEVDPRSKIANLHPFLDEDGILRVGGRLRNSELPYNHKHPILLEKSYVAELIIKEVHIATLHGGNSLVISIIRRKYWYTGMRNLVKKVLRYCARCIRYRKNNANQIMGDLPQMRVSVSHPFTHTGVDYAGPIQMRCSRGRGQKSFKGYIAVFVCMATRAIHLEAVSDLTSDGFLAALRRFFARRGKAKCLYSDNGTNFVGAARKLDKEFMDAVKNNHSVYNKLESEKIQWRFIPPASPHFGGIWEAGVKSVKYHIRRVIGENMLTYEEMSTLLAQVEAVLNSRPLYTMNQSSEEIDVLTPGHFLIGQPLVGDPEVIDDSRISSLNRWKIIQKMKKDFWQRWKDEYLTTLQHRYKWKSGEENLKQNQVVIVKDEATSPAKWPLGRIIETHAGKDGKVRVVTLKMENGVLKRPIHKLCPLEKMEDSTKEDKRGEAAKSQLAQYTSRRCLQPRVLWWWAVMLCVVLSSVRSLPMPDVNGMIKELGNGTIIYADRIGKMNRVTSSWSLVAYYNMDAYFATVDNIAISIPKCKMICSKLRSFEKQCASVLTVMENKLKDIQENDELFSHQYLNKTRVKRAPFEFVGSLYNVLFGMMDADDRELVEENMRKLLENQHNIKSLVEQQTSVVESTANILKKTTEEVNSHFNDINAKVNQISDLLNTDYFVYKESINFFMMTKQLEVLVNEAEKIQMQIIGLLIDINHGKINPNLIRPNKLQDEILKIKEHLPDKLRLPGKSKDAVLQAVYRLMTARGVFVDGALVIDIKIPLLERFSSDIFNIIPIPILKDGLTMVAKLKQQFVVYNYELDSYHLITQPTLNQCQKDGEDEYLCKGNWAWEDANDNSCELATLKPSNSHNCVFMQVKTKNIWLELHERSNWVFRIFSSATAHVLCQRTQNVVELPGQGVITLPAGCTARIGRTILSSPQEVKSEQYNSFRTYLVKEVKDFEMLKPWNDVPINHTAEVESLLKQIENIKSHYIELKSLNWHNISGHSSLTLILVIIIVCIVIMIRRRCVTKRNIVDVKFNVPRQNVQT